MAKKHKIAKAVDRDLHDVITEDKIFKSKTYLSGDKKSIRRWFLEHGPEYARRYPRLHTWAFHNERGTKPRLPGKFTFRPW